MVCAVCSAARLSTPAPPEPLPHLYASANQLPEEDDPVRLGNLDDAPDYFINDAVVRFTMLSYVFSRGCHGVSESRCVRDYIKYS